MKICYINYEKYGGGSWVHTTQFIAALKEIHDDVVVHTPLARQDAPEDDEQESQESFSNILNHLREIRLLVVMFTRQAAAEFRLLKKERPDVVILRMARYRSAVLLCRLLKIPLVLEINAPPMEDQFMPKEQQLRGKSFWALVDKKIMGLATHNMVVSETLRQHYITCGISAEKISSVPNGVDPQVFHPDISGNRIREQLGLQNKTVVGFSGSFAPWHGLPLLAEAIELICESNQYEELALLLIGEPSDILEMPDFPAAVTTITGHVPHEDIPEYLAVIDIFVAPYPKITPFYFSPLKIFEAMALGKSVISSAQGQICELITDNVSGLLYPPGDQAALVEQIQRLMTDIQLRHELGKNARKVMEDNFTWKDNAGRMLKLCQDAVAQ
ncbi:MAG: glycosyltransferase family 4 protein [Candidatus Electrothrix sp. YB6]